MTVFSVLMSGLARTVLVMTLSGSLLTLILVLLKPLLRHRVPKTVQYGLWLVVLAALLIPASRLLVLPALPAPATLTPIHTAVEQSLSAVEAKSTVSVPSSQDLSQGISAAPMSGEKNGIFSGIWTGFLMVYPLGVVIVLLYRVLSYTYFLGKIRFRKAVAMPAVSVAELCGGIRRAPRVYLCPLAATPMLVGLFRPKIVLPDQEYTNTQLKNIMLHELTHLRRRDTFVKWLSVLACALHWFNPVVWLAKGEIGRICELACDAAVIRNMDRNHQKMYGSTLIAMVADAAASRAVLSATMCEERKDLEERLLSIKAYKPHSRTADAVSVLLLVTAVCIACLLGASSGSAAAAPENTAVAGPSDPLSQEISHMPGWKQTLVMSDDFPGTSVDTAKWNKAWPTTTLTFSHGRMLPEEGYAYLTSPAMSCYAVEFSFTKEDQLDPDSYLRLQLRIPQQLGHNSYQMMILFRPTKIRYLVSEPVEHTLSNQGTQEGDQIWGRIEVINGWVAVYTKTVPAEDYTRQGDSFFIESLYDTPTAMCFSSYQVKAHIDDVRLYALSPRESQGK